MKYGDLFLFSKSNNALIMKKILLIFLVLSSMLINAQVTTTPTTFEATTTGVVINFNKTGTPLANYTGILYAHIGLTVNGVQWQAGTVIGSWGNNTTQPAFVQTGSSTYTLTIPTNLYTYFNVPTTSSITQICLVIRNDLGTLKNSASDTFINVGAFQATLTAPVQNSTTIISSGTNLTITANNTGGTASYNLLANGVSINTYSGVIYSYPDANITFNKSYELQITQGATTFSKKFAVIVNPGTISAALPVNVEDGINYNTSDPTKATLVLTAPGKDFVYVAGSFNNWQPTTPYAMKKDPATGKFWLELTGLTSGATNSYQYWVVDQTPTTNSPALVKTADPFSTLVLSPFDDQWNPPGNYPDLPPYPAGQEREVTVLQTGQTPYNWSAATTNFVKPEKDNLVVYEVLVRDFDANKSFQNLIDRIDYFKNLKINAIQLMPVMEFEGTESWGYNTSFHLALDKAYGTASKLKEFVDLCHQNGIAVILDVALNHAFGRNPMDRMWMSDPDGDGWGGPASDNPYFNVTATHSYGVGNDFNHQSAYTKYYVKRVIKQWVQEFKIDGFRWDLTKGFTQNCTGSDSCTNSYQQDRVDVLKEYADYSWSLDASHYVIFEHLGADNEEQQWANYRINETPSKGVMMWGEMTTGYSQLLMGYSSNSDITRMGNTAHGFTAKRVIGYPESHDKERIMYSAVTYGNSSNASHNVKTLTTAMSRMSAVGAVSLLVPGPKMIWHFADLGNSASIFTCNNGTVNTDTDATAGDCKLDTKQQFQWTNNWLGDVNRSKIYSDWSKMIDLKKTETVFKGSYSINSGATLTPKIYIWDDTLPITTLKNVVILSNFDVNTQSITPNFPFVGTWYNLMDNSIVSVNGTMDPISIEAGGFRIYGNHQSSLGTNNFETMTMVSLYPNPTSNHFVINTNTTKVHIYNLTGQLVKTYLGLHSDSFQFDSDDLSNGVYLVKATDVYNNEKTMKLVKQ
jgi:1,4-alpha-glucan branching enzyme